MASCQLSVTRISFRSTLAFSAVSLDLLVPAGSPHPISFRSAMQHNEAHQGRSLASPDDTSTLRPAEEPEAANGRRLAIRRFVEEGSGRESDAIGLDRWDLGDGGAGRVK
ncbi:hypothetical protein COCNU_10G006710 [Cocos nucifera]|uniref:Uncharacterized protein n=1 Tax=Cocos nucifera TaxID=13894 RepID=A0A8K0IMS9_COCNU|nr:hypothetical protein COCNU_10G006710 [Cocos nucifera]